MGAAIGQTLPLAVGVLLSPLPIVAVVLMLVTPRAAVNGPSFVAGWLVGLSAVGFIVLAVSSGASASDDGEPAAWVSWLKLLLGLLLLVIAAKQWGARPHGDEDAPTPKWMGALDSFGAAKAFAAGALLAGVNPKNLLLAAAAAMTIAQTGISSSDQVIAYLVFALIATLSVAAPVAFYLLKRDQSRDFLAGLKEWMSHHNAAIMAALCLVIGAKLIGEAIAGLT